MQPVHKASSPSAAARWLARQVNRGVLSPHDLTPTALKAAAIASRPSLGAATFHNDRSASHRRVTVLTAATVLFPRLAENPSVLSRASLAVAASISQMGMANGSFRAAEPEFSDVDAIRHGVLVRWMRSTQWKAEDLAQEPDCWNLITHVAAGLFTALAVETGPHHAEVDAEVGQVSQCALGFVLEAMECLASTVGSRHPVAGCETDHGIHPRETGSALEAASICAVTAVRELAEFLAWSMRESGRDSVEAALRAQLWSIMQHLERVATAAALREAKQIPDAIAVKRAVVVRDNTTTTTTTRTHAGVNLDDANGAKTSSGLARLAQHLRSAQPQAVHARFAETVVQFSDSAASSWVSALALLSWLTERGVAPSTRAILHAFSTLSTASCGSETMATPPAPPVQADVVVTLRSKQDEVITLLMRSARLMVDHVPTTPKAVYLARSSLVNFALQNVLKSCSNVAKNPIESRKSFLQCVDACVRQSAAWSEASYIVSASLSRGIIPFRQTMATLALQLRSAQRTDVLSQLVAQLATDEKHSLLPRAASESTDAAIHPTMTMLYDLCRRGQWIPALAAWGNILLAPHIRDEPRAQPSCAVRGSSKVTMFQRESIARAVLYCACRAHSWTGALVALSRGKEAFGPQLPVEVVRRVLPLVSKAGRWMEASTLYVGLSSSTESSVYSGQLVCWVTSACRADGQWQAAARIVDALSSTAATAVPLAAVCDVIAACVAAGFSFTAVKLWLKGPGGSLLLGDESSDITAVAVLTALQQIAKRNEYEGHRRDGAQRTEAPPTAHDGAKRLGSRPSRDGGPVLVSAAVTAEADRPWWAALELFSSHCVRAWPAQSDERQHRMADTRSPLSAASCLVLETCIRDGKWLRAIDVWRALRLMGAPVGRHGIHAMLGMCAARRLDTLADAVLAESHETDALVRDAYVAACCATMRWQEALSHCTLYQHYSDFAFEKIVLCAATPSWTALRVAARMAMLPVSDSHVVGTALVRHAANCSLSEHEGHATDRQWQRAMELVTSNRMVTGLSDTSTDLLSVVLAARGAIPLKIGLRALSARLHNPRLLSTVEARAAAKLLLRCGKWSAGAAMMAQNFNAVGDDALGLA